MHVCTDWTQQVENIRDQQFSNKTGYPYQGPDYKFQGKTGFPYIFT